MQCVPEHCAQGVIGMVGIRQSSDPARRFCLFTFSEESPGTFQERHVYLDEPVKIGRSVARCRPAQNNATFDCKVLSRNHALIWFDHKTGKFYLQDTKSSNGTFINSQRLSRGSEESPPCEILSGDIIQFGVDVTENTRKGSAHRYQPYADSGGAKTNTRCLPKHMPLAARFFTHCRLTMQPPRATALEDNAALGSLQASPQAPGQTTGVAGALGGYFEEKMTRKHLSAQSVANLLMESVPDDADSECEPSDTSSSEEINRSTVVMKTSL
ncbi:UNVERIFIED_CONTAM: hypothetical protein FKN15_012786 [Acipenser sinensis]